MKSKDKFINKYPTAEVKTSHKNGEFKQYEIWVGANKIASQNRESWAWAQALRKPLIF